MAEFAQPPARRPAIPKPVPVEQLDGARQAEYAALVEANKKLDGKIEESAPFNSLANTKLVPDTTISYAPGAQPVMSRVPADSVKQEPKPWDPTDEDKKNFVRSILGGKDYEKSYTLFGSVKVVFGDRGVDLTERMYDALEADGKDGPRIHIDTDEQWSVWAERYMLGATLRSVTMEKTPAKSFAPPENFHDRFEELSAYPRPLYQALMEAARTFELHIRELVSKAQDANFWKTGGAN